MEKKVMFVVWFSVRNYPEDQGIAGIYESFDDAVSALVEYGAVSDYPTDSSCIDYYDEENSMFFTIVKKVVGGELFSR